MVLLSTLSDLFVMCLNIQNRLILPSWLEIWDSSRLSYTVDNMHVSIKYYMHLICVL